MKKKVLLVLGIASVMSMTCFEGIASAEAGDALFEEQIILDEVDDSTSNRLSIDDFDSLEDYNAYLEEKGLGGSGIEFTASSDFKGSDANSTIKLDNAKYTIKGLNGNRAIQNFYVGSNYIYVTQHMGEGDVCLSRCELSGSIATFKDSMTLTNVGHGATLENYVYNNKEYFLITAKNNPVIDGNEERYYSIQVGRIEYRPNVNVDNLEISRFCNLNYANKSNTRFSDIRRVNAALTTDKSKILLWVRNSGDDKNINVQYSIYDFNVFNQQLDLADKNSNRLANFVDNYVMKDACEYSTVQYGYGCILPNGSFQGIDIANLGNTGKHAVYIGSGRVTPDDTTNRPLMIAHASYDKSNSTFTFKESTKIQVTGLANCEMEGVHVINTSELYFGAVDSSNKSTAYIYSVQR